TGVEQLVDDLVELVDLDRIDAPVDVLVPGLRDRVLERLVDALDLRAQHVLEPDQDRELYAAAAQLLDDVDDVHRRRGRIERTHGNVPVLVDEEVGVAPARDAIELRRIGNAP